MKTIFISTLAAAGLALSISSAFAGDISPSARVVTGSQLYPHGTTQQDASTSHARFLSGGTNHESEFNSLSDNAIQAREFSAVQQGSHWLQEGDAY